MPCILDLNVIKWCDKCGFVPNESVKFSTDPFKGKQWYFVTKTSVIVLKEMLLA